MRNYITMKQIDDAIHTGFIPLKKIAVFNLDHTILRSGFIQTAAKEFGFGKELIYAERNDTNPFARNKRMARFLKGRTIGELLELTDTIATTPNLAYLISVLKEQGHITGIISNGFDCVANHIRDKFGLDFAISNELVCPQNIVTGEMRIPPVFLANGKSQCRHDYCKLNALIAVCGRYKVDLSDTIVIGDGENDICCIKKAGMGISFCSTYGYMDAVADHVIKEADFNLLIPVIT